MFVLKKTKQIRDNNGDMNKLYIYELNGLMSIKISLEMIIRVSIDKMVCFDILKNLTTLAVKLSKQIHIHTQ